MQISALPLSVYRDLPCTSHPNTCIAFTNINISYQSGTSAAIGKPPLTHHNLSRVHSLRYGSPIDCTLCGVVCEFGQVYNDMYHLYCITEYFHCHKNLHCSTCSSLHSPHPPHPGNYWAFYCLHSFVYSQCHLGEVIQWVCFSGFCFVLFSLSDRHLRLFHPPCCFMTWQLLLFFPPNNISWNSPQFIHPPTYWRLSWLLPSFASYDEAAVNIWVRIQCGY